MTEGSFWNYIRQKKENEKLYYEASTLEEKNKRQKNTVKKLKTIIKKLAKNEPLTEQEQKTVNKITR